jgi:hypothetical protein
LQFHNEDVAPASYSAKLPESAKLAALTEVAVKLREVLLQHGLREGRTNHDVKEQEEFKEGEEAVC